MNNLTFVSKLTILLFIVAFGMALAVIFAYHLLIDWRELDQAYLNFSKIAQSSPNLTALFRAEAQQNIHRINVFAEGVWLLLSLIIAAIGLHGVCTFRR